MHQERLKCPSPCTRIMNPGEGNYLTMPSPHPGITSHRHAPRRCQPEVDERWEAGGLGAQPHVPPELLMSPAGTVAHVPPRRSLRDCRMDRLADLIGNAVHRPATGGRGRRWGRACIAILTGVLALGGCGGTTTPRSSGAGIAGPGLASACAQIRHQYPHLPGELTVAVSPYNANSEKIDPQEPSKIIGLEPSMISEIASCLHFTYTYSNQSFAGVIAAVTSGADQMGITGIYVTPARVKVIDLVSYRRSSEQAVLNSSIASKVHTVDDFCGLTSGVTTGSIELGYLQSLSQKCQEMGKRPIQIQVFQDVASISLALANGRLDFSIGASELVSPEVKQYSGKLVAGFIIPDLGFDIGIGVSKKEPELAHATLAAVKAIQKAGIERRLLAQWGYPPSTQVPAVLYTG
jgi:polar amino acid transport system substrate-binding protein